MNRNTIVQSDALELCHTMDDQSVNLILCDLPYGTSACAWDVIIPFEPMWTEFKRIIKPRSAIVLTATQPFTTTLIASNITMFKYSWVWVKSIAFDFFNAKNKPMKQHEDIVVFSTGTTANKSSNKMPYYPQNLKKIDAQWSRPRFYGSDHKLDRPSHQLSRIVEFENYPRDVLYFPNGNQKTIHPTEKPVDLFRYLIRTYTLPGELVFDPCLGSGTTALAARAEKRDFICGDISQEYVSEALERLRLPFEKHHVTQNNDMSGLPLFEKLP